MSSVDSKRCYAIIVTYNGEKWIKDCLTSLLKSSLQPEILIIDNGSSDSTLAIIKSYGTVRLLENDKNLGFGAANNMGLKLAFDEGAEYFFLVNQDVFIEENTVRELIKLMDERPEYGIVSPIHLNGKGDALDTPFEGYMKKECSKTLLNDYANNTLKRFYEVPFVNAASWMISRTCLEKIGIFHPLFFHYGEDNNYVSRVLDKAFRIAVLAATKIRHDREQRKSNPFKDNPKVIFNWKTTVNSLDKRVSHIKRFFLIVIDLFTIASRVPAKERLTFLKHGIEDWVSISKRSREFDKKELDIRTFKPN